MSDSAALLLERLRAATDPHGALSEFCRKSGLPRRTVENWLGGTTIPTTAMDAIAHGLGVSPWDLLKPAETHAPARADPRESLLGAIVVRLASLKEDELRAFQGLVDRAVELAEVQRLGDGQKNSDLRRKS